MLMLIVRFSYEDPAFHPLVDLLGLKVLTEVSEQILAEVAKMSR